MDTKGLQEMLNLQRLSSLTVIGNSKQEKKKKQTPSFPAGQLCPSPPVIDHGQHDGMDMEFIPGMSVNYSCDPGYSLTGTAALYCTGNASWSSPQPRCEGELSMPSAPRKGGHCGVSARTKGRGLQQPLSGIEEQMGQDLNLQSPSFPA